MSPHVEHGDVFPFQRNRYNQSVGHIISKALDDLLLDHARSNTTFTIITLRNLMLQKPGLEGVDKTMVRYRVRDRLRVLEKHDLLEYVGLKGKRRKIFRLRLENVPPAQRKLSSASEASPEAAVELPSNRIEEADTDLHIYLDRERHTLRAEMYTVMGESEHYRKLLEQFPQEAGRITPLLDVSIAQGSQLKGKLDANIKLRRTLADEGPEEGEA